jgi:hypothetical protein
MRRWNPIEELDKEEERWNGMVFSLVRSSVSVNLAARQRLSAC